MQYSLTATLYINTFKQEPGATKAYELQTRRMRRLWLMTIAVIQPLGLLLVLKKTKRDFLRYTGYLNFIRFTAGTFRKLLSIYVFSYFPSVLEGRMWDLIVSVPDHCLSFYFSQKTIYITFVLALALNFQKYLHHTSLLLKII